MLKKLNRETVATPGRPIKILQFGEGNFLRAFVDWMVDIMNEKGGFNGDVKVIQPIKHGMGHLVNEQGGLYHVVLQGIKNGIQIDESRLITCVKEVINPYVDYEAFLKTGENPDLEFVISNTTEAGIVFDPSDASHQSLPVSFPGKLTALLYHRFVHFGGDSAKALNIIPCELIERNGDMLRAEILQYTEHWDLPKEFKEWIKDHTTFANTLVDRIVPGFPKDKISSIHQQLGYDDKLVVMAEPFHLWVIEGPESLGKKFPANKAGLEVKFVHDQSPYRTRKVRILNGVHTALVPLAYLRGLRTVSESIEDPTMSEFIRKLVFDEIIPTLDQPKTELIQFANDVLERFRNPYIRHELISIALNSVSKFRVRVLPSIVEYINLRKAPPENLTLSLAALILFYRGSFNSMSIPLSDTPEVINFMKEAWSKNEAEVAVARVLAHTAFWERDLTSIDGLHEQVLLSIRRLSATNAVISDQ